MQIVESFYLSNMKYKLGKGRTYTPCFSRSTMKHNTVCLATIALADNLSLPSNVRSSILYFPVLTKNPRDNH